MTRVKYTEHLKIGSILKSWETITLKFVDTPSSFSQSFPEKRKILSKGSLVCLMIQKVQPKNASSDCPSIKRYYHDIVYHDINFM